VALGKLYTSLFDASDLASEAERELEEGGDLGLERLETVAAKLGLDARRPWRK
jgi:hypothetical protein